MRCGQFPIIFLQKRVDTGEQIVVAADPHLPAGRINDENGFGHASGDVAYGDGVSKQSSSTKATKVATARCRSCPSKPARFKWKTLVRRQTQVTSPLYVVRGKIYWVAGFGSRATTHKLYI